MSRWFGCFLALLVIASSLSTSEASDGYGGGNDDYQQSRPSSLKVNLGLNIPPIIFKMRPMTLPGLTLSTNLINKPYAKPMTIQMPQLPQISFGQQQQQYENGGGEGGDYSQQQYSQGNAGGGDAYSSGSNQKAVRIETPTQNYQPQQKRSPRLQQHHQPQASPQSSPQSNADHGAYGTNNVPSYRYLPPQELTQQAPGGQAAYPSSGAQSPPHPMLLPPPNMPYLPPFPGYPSPYGPPMPFPFPPPGAANVPPMMAPPMSPAAYHQPPPLPPPMINAPSVEQQQQQQPRPQQHNQPPPSQNYQPQPQQHYQVEQKMPLPIPMVLPVSQHESKAYQPQQGREEMLMYQYEAPVQHQHQLPEHSGRLQIETGHTQNSHHHHQNHQQQQLSYSPAMQVAYQPLMVQMPANAAGPAPVAPGKYAQYQLVDGPSSEDIGQAYNAAPRVPVRAVNNFVEADYRRPYHQQ